MFIIEVMVGGGFFVDVKSFNGVQVWDFYEIVRLA